MKNFFIINLSLIFSVFIIADEVDSSDSESKGYILMSTYEMAYGGKFKDLEKNLIEETKAGVKDGYDACSLYRHVQGSQRAFYMVCSFKTMNNLQK